MDLHVIAVSIAGGRPTFGQPTWTSIAFVIAWLFFCRLSSFATEDLEALLCEAVLDCLRRAGLTVEQAADVMKINYFNLQKALKRERGRAIPLLALFRLPFLFWMFFLPELSYLVAKKHVRECAEDLGVRRTS